MLLAWKKAVQIHTADLSIFYTAKRKKNVVKQETYKYEYLSNYIAKTF